MMLQAARLLLKALVIFDIFIFLSKRPAGRFVAVGLLSPLKSRLNGLLSIKECHHTEVLNCEEYHRKL